MCDSCIPGNWDVLRCRQRNCILQNNNKQIPRCDRRKAWDHFQVACVQLCQTPSSSSPNWKDISSYHLLTLVSFLCQSDTKKHNCCRFPTSMTDFLESRHSRSPFADIFPELQSVRPAEKVLCDLASHSHLHLSGRELCCREKGFPVTVLHVAVPSLKDTCSSCACFDIGPSGVIQTNRWKVVLNRSAASL